MIFRKEILLDFGVFNVVYNEKAGHLAIQSTTGQVYKYGN
jgi:hypothetical protein